MKNLVSQLSRSLRNFEKHVDSPDFQRDMLATVQSVVERMNNLMARLSGEPDTSKSESVAIRPLIEAIIGEKCLANAAIMLDCPPGLSDLRVRADTRRVDAILRHLFQHAIECCGHDGTIVVGLRRDHNAAEIGRASCRERVCQ